MKIRELAHQWEQQTPASGATRSYRLDLELETAARLEALCELYPQRTPEALLSELLAAAFEELEASFPYVKGDEVVATDELGDPLYADAGVGRNSIASEHSWRMSGHRIRPQRWTRAGYQRPLRPPKRTGQGFLPLAAFTDKAPALPVPAACF